MKEREKRNIVIVILCLMIVFMSMGYAVLSQKLKIEGILSIAASWKIEIIDISFESVGEGKNILAKVEQNNISATFEANLKKPNDAVIYTVRVKNKGTIDAVLESIKPENYKDGDVSFTITGKEKCMYLDSGSSCDFKVKVEYLDTGKDQKPMAEGTKIEQKIIIKYVQKTTTNSETESTPNRGDVFDTEEEKESDFLVTSDGMLLSYRGTNPNVVVPAEVNGIKITKIAPFAFNKSDFIIIIFANDERKAIITNDALAENIRELSTQYGIVEYPREDVYTKLTIDDIDMSGDIGKNFIPHIISEQKGLIGGEADDNLEFHHITNLDLSQMVHLEEIGYAILMGYAGDSSECPNQNSGCGLGLLTSLKLPMNGVLHTIGESAFSYNQLTTIEFPESLKLIRISAFSSNKLTGNITIPASVTTIRDNAFQGNNLTSATILGDKTRFDSNWSGQKGSIFDTGVIRVPE